MMTWESSQYLVRKALRKLYLEFDYNLGIEKIWNRNIQNANMLMMALFD